MKVALVGVTGYSGTVLYQLLCQHPAVDEINLYGHSEVNIHLSAVLPYLNTPTDPMIYALDVHKLMAENDCVFFATSAGVTAKLAGEFIAAKFPVIDLSGDMRLKDPAAYSKWYHKEPAAAADLAQATYGLAEFTPKLSSYVANPGCYATATLLGLAPLVQQKLIDVQSIIVDAKSGTTGAGKKLAPSTHFANADENFSVYKANKHQHIPEIVQQLHAWDHNVTALQFTTSLLPVARGIMSSIYAHVQPELAAQGAGTVNAKLTAAFKSTYAAAPCVHLAGADLPTLRDVNYSNLDAIGWLYNPATQVVTAISVIDNLLKGAAGQALQNFNQMFGYPETTAIPLQPALI